MPPLPTTTAAALARRARDLLKDAAELTSGRDPNYIRDAQPDSIFEAIPLAAARQGCRRYADNPDQYSGLRQARVERACRPYLDALEYGEPPSINLPFRGGQCYDTGYDFTFTATTPNGDRASSQQGTSGRLVGVRQVTLSNGNTQAGYLRQLSPSAPVDFIPLQIGNPGADLNPVITNVVKRPGGTDDNCGNPTPEIDPPVPPPVPSPPKQPFVRFPDIDIDIEVDVNPDLTIDVDFGTGPITIDPFGDEGDGGDGGGGGPPPGDVGDPGAPGMTGEGGEASGEAPEGSVLTGLRVDFVEPPIGGKQYAEGVYRGVCYIYMGTPEGLDHDPAGAMLRDGQFVYAEKDNLTRWRISANRGYNLLVTPYYRAVEA